MARRRVIMLVIFEIRKGSREDRAERAESEREGCERRERTSATA